MLGLGKGNLSVCIVKRNKVAYVHTAAHNHESFQKIALMANKETVGKCLGVSSPYTTD